MNGKSRKCGSRFAWGVCLLGLVSPAVAQTPPETPDNPTESAPIAPIDLPQIDGIRGDAVEPPAAAHAGRVVSPAAEAAEIIASGRFLAPLIPEGGYLTRAAGSLGRDEFLSVWTLDLSDRVDGAAGRSMILLPTDTFADMIQLHLATIKDGTSPPLFEVSGPILVFRSNNFLLPTFAHPIDRRVDRAPSEPLVPPGAKRSAALGAIAVAAAPNQSPAESVIPQTAPSAKTPTGPAVDQRIDPETFAQELERRLDQRVAVVPSTSDPSIAALPAPPGVEQPSISPPFPSHEIDVQAPMIGARTTDVSASDSQPDAQLLPPMRVQSRRGTVTRDPISGSWRFVFASGVRDDGDLSLELLPCSMLTKLITVARSSATAASVLLTGDITLFEGRNYLRPVRFQSLGAGKWIGP
ncbi:MAG: hypothetical protein EXS15_05535 [Phycisphaerales bacterium]|nr:hypothetical protein [Phycisphaerales bacterium]